MKNKTKNDLIKIIDFLEDKYDTITKSWQENSGFFLNMKKLQVKDFYNNSLLLNYVYDYREFIFNDYIIMDGELTSMFFFRHISSRIKNANSIQDKINRYYNGKEKGKIAIKKCLNDLVGLRIVLAEEVSYEQINEFIINNYPTLKCIKASKHGYSATHIYFGNDNNNNFQWELQIWNNETELSNLLYHELYKQNYLYWEGSDIKCITIS